MKILLFLTAVMLMLTAAPLAAYAKSGEAEQELLNHISSFDYSGIEREIANDRNISKDFSFTDTVMSAIRGELDLSPANLLNKTLHLLFNEVYSAGSLMKNLMVVAILGAIINSLARSNKKMGIGELGFYVTYITLVGVLFTSFCVAAGIIQDMILSLSGLMKAAVPLTASMLFISGNMAGAYTFQALLMFAANISSSIIVNLIAPIIILGASIRIINYITEQDILTSFSDLISKGCSWALKLLTGFFMAALSLQRISAPIINNLTVKTARLAVNSVPVVGGALSGAIDSVAVWIGAAKSGVSVALIIFVAAACALPVLKLAALILVYKLTAAFIQPVCDPRIVKCIDAISSYSMLLLGTGASVAVMFIFSVIVLLSF